MISTQPDRETPRLTGRRIAALQAAFYISTGLWPLLHRHSFERVTGPKVDFWLAQTVVPLSPRSALALPTPGHNRDRYRLSCAR
jgi:hypothetical protein